MQFVGYEPKSFLATHHCGSFLFVCKVFLNNSTESIQWYKQKVSGVLYIGFRNRMGNFTEITRMRHRGTDQYWESFQFFLVMSVACFWFLTILKIFYVDNTRNSVRKHDVMLQWSISYVRQSYLWATTLIQGWRRYCRKFVSTPKWLKGKLGYENSDLDNASKN